MLILNYYVNILFVNISEQKKGHVIRP